MTDVSGQAHRWLSALVIVSLVTGCDNVQWAGAEVRLEPPPPTTFGTPAVPDSMARRGSGPVMPEGPVLFMATRDSLVTTLVPVAVISGDSLVALPSEDVVPGFRAAFSRERMAEGTEFVLFAEGTRVGTLTAHEHVTEDSFCEPRPAVRGPVELVREAGDASRFLALRREHAAGAEHGSFRTFEHDRAQRIASINLVGEIIPQVGARWPTSLEAARQDMQAFRLGDDGPDAFTATFVFRDRMGIAEAEPSSYALFLMGVQQDGEYRPAHVWYREAGREGRGVPRLFGHYDWDGDGETNILLEVLGERSRWTAAVTREGNEWHRVWQDPCGAAAPPVTDEEEG